MALPKEMHPIVTKELCLPKGQTAADLGPGDTASYAICITNPGIPREVTICDPVPICVDPDTVVWFSDSLSITGTGDLVETVILPPGKHTVTYEFVIPEAPTAAGCVTSITNAVCIKDECNVLAEAIADQIVLGDPDDLAVQNADHPGDNERFIRALFENMNLCDRARLIDVLNKGLSLADLVGVGSDKADRLCAMLDWYECAFPPEEEPAEEEPAEEENDG